MSIITMLLLISLLILIHEAGHFFSARFFGIRVSKFGFGLPIGPTLFEKKIGDVTYCIHAFLLGGYVAFPDDDPESDIPLDDPSRLNNKPIWQRAVVISAGIVANMIAAFIIILIVSLFVGGVPSDKDKIFITDFNEAVPIAKNAGFNVKDQIIAINNVQINSFYDFRRVLEANKAEDGYVSDIDVRNQFINIIKANPDLFKDVVVNPSSPAHEEVLNLENRVIKQKDRLIIPKASVGEAFIPNLKDVLAKLNPLPEKAKLKKEENELSKSIKQSNNIFTGNGSTTFGNIARATADNSKLLTVKVLRKGEMVDINVSPNNEGMIGIKPEVVDIYQKITSPTQLLGNTWNYVENKTILMVYGLYKIFTGQVNLTDLNGILAITKVGGEVIERKGLTDGWILAALISINLAIVNLLPIPALDGGHLMFLFIEKLRGRPVEEKFQETITQYCFLLLIGLMVLILFNDIVSIVTNKI